MESSDNHIWPTDTDNNHVCESKPSTMSIRREHTKAKPQSEKNCNVAVVGTHQRVYSTDYPCDWFRRVFFCSRFDYVAFRRVWFFSMAQVDYKTLCCSAIRWLSPTCRDYRDRKPPKVIRQYRAKMEWTEIIKKNFKQKITRSRASRWNFSGEYERCSSLKI